MADNVLGPAVVTGGSGFIGRHLVSALLARGVDTEVWTRAEGPASTAAQVVPTRSVDLLDCRSIRAALASAPAKTVFHLAGTRGTPHDPCTYCLEWNTLATIRLLQEAHLAGVTRIVIIGSAEEYGAQPGPQSEELPLKPATAYGISKAAATQMAQVLSDRDGCPVVVIRPFTIYGPGQPRSMFLAQAVTAAVQGAGFAMSPGTQRRDFIHVTDVVRALIQAAGTPGIDGTVVNVGSGEPRKLREVAERVWAEAGAVGKLGIGERAAQPSEMYDTWAEISRARKILGWSPTTSFDAGLSEMIAAEHVTAMIASEHHGSGRESRVSHG